MGIIAISSSKLKFDVIKRFKRNNKVDLSAGSVKITLYDGQIDGAIHAPEAKLELLWHAT